ncbi:CbtB-domain containing protein [Mesorhizobium sp. BR1-1-16]|uniref:CbtB domain-containing protein n=1 Tax=Mesorhizobium sp. BR1-1-16 TaxID=2876653 RepID=UPI001CCAA5C4|nr:CbtB domain-containing protein [Mesorhizobium sp. BR1-1-16]MBZ9939317.1 CbtB-domain containing protein [Mesorhizobium sp. BR1-1-16]
MNASTASSPSISGRPLAATRFAAGFAALAFGLVVFLATGFAAPSQIHNATHDTRHAFGLPCH